LEPGENGKAATSKKKKDASSLQWIVPSQEGLHLPPPKLIDSANGKPRLIWSEELHAHFEKCVKQLGSGMDILTEYYSIM